MLWLPEHMGELLCVTVDVGATQSDFDGMMQINASAFDWLEGRLDTAAYLDLLDYYRLDPFEFVEPVINFFDS